MSKELISMTQADMCASLFATGKSAMMVAEMCIRDRYRAASTAHSGQGRAMEGIRSIWAMTYPNTNMGRG